jgi:hypothetical protein
MQKYAKQASVLDILGIRLGMTPNEAFAAVHAFDPKLRIDIVKAKLDLPDVPEGQQPLIPRYGIAYTGPTITSGDDLIWIQFTTPPNPPLVESITREVRFPEGHPVFASTLLARLRKKYGHESVPSNSQNLPMWIYGSDGKLLQRRLIQQGDERYCGWATPMLPNMGNNGMDQDVRWGQMGPVCKGSLLQRRLLVRRKIRMHSIHHCNDGRKCGFDFAKRAELCGDGWH